MNIAWGGEVVLEYRGLRGRRPSQSLPQRECRWRSARRSVSTSPGTRPQDRSIECPGDEALSVAIASGGHSNQCGRSDELPAIVSLRRRLLTRSHPTVTFTSVGCRRKSPTTRRSPWL